MKKLMTPRGQALRLGLLMIFEAACGPAPRGNRLTPTKRPLHRWTTSEKAGWCDLLAIPATARAVKERATQTANRLRQAKAALEKLERRGIVTLGAARRRDRYEEFVLHPETGPGDLVTPVGYSRPNAEEGFPVSAEFFLNGWLWALNDSEIAAYLMFCHLAWCYPTQHKANGVFVVGGDRDDFYCLSKDTYETHRLLSGVGLLEFLPAPGRASDGKWEGFGPGAALEAHRFRVTDDGPNESAVEGLLSEWLFPI